MFNTKAFIAVWCPGENRPFRSERQQFWLPWTQVDTRWCCCNGNYQFGDQCVTVFFLMNLLMAAVIHEAKFAVLAI